MDKPGDLTDESEATFFKLMSLEDELGVVVRAGAYIDNQLIRLIDECVASPQAIKRMGLTYENRIDLAIALGLDSRFRAPLTALGKIRNTFAHRIDATLGSSEAHAVYKALSPDDCSKVHAIYKKLQVRYPSRPKAFINLPPLDRFRLVAVTLRQILVVARMQVATARGHSRQT
ncbi:hypothetical protein NKH19_06030 [Mesorhizobium sp. M1338]|uniref:hypothetical protein n=1 Tax=Mesorhizobium sp. M1338 TaxID=2957085 RepID=UPI00333909D0